jgi:hypothetical protein
VNALKRSINSVEKEFSDEPDKMRKKIEDIRNKEIKSLLFDSYLQVIDNKKKGHQDITSMFRKLK